MRLRLDFTVNCGMIERTGFLHRIFILDCVPSAPASDAHSASSAALALEQTPQRFFEHGRGTGGACSKSLYAPHSKSQRVQLADDNFISRHGRLRVSQVKRSGEMNEAVCIYRAARAIRVVDRGGVCQAGSRAGSKAPLPIAGEQGNLLAAWRASRRGRAAEQVRRRQEGRPVTGLVERKGSGIPTQKASATKPVRCILQLACTMERPDFCG